MSCSPTESDFVGEYHTLYSAKIEIANQVDFFSYGYGKKRKTTAKAYHDLGDIKLTLFMDESAKQLGGELRMSEVVKKGFFGTSTSLENVDFDVNNFRIVNDTLIFSLENQILKLEQRKIGGRLIKNGNQVFIGLEKNLTGWSKEAETNPLYCSIQKDLIYHRVLTGRLIRDSVVREFYGLQILEMTKQFNQSQNDTEQTILQNSIDELKKRLEI
jgi:hypothetical protein